MRLFWLLAYLGAIGYCTWWLISSIRARLFHEVYAALGIALYFSNLMFGGLGPRLGIRPLEIAGLVLYAPAALLVILGFLTLHRLGRPKQGWEPATAIIQTGVFRLTRHPVFFGTALWTFAVLLVYQSIIAAVLTPAIIFCLYQASVGGEAATYGKLGAEYAIYCQQVPRWNVLAGLLRLLRRR